MYGLSASSSNQSCTCSRSTGGRERPERFAELDLQVHHRLHLRRARVADDGPAAERAGAELHASLQQPDDFLLGEQRRDLIGQRRPDRRRRAL